MPYIFTWFPTILPAMYSARLIAEPYMYAYLAAGYLHLREWYWSVEPSQHLVTLSEVFDLYQARSERQPISHFAGEWHVQALTVFFHLLVYPEHPVLHYTALMHNSITS
ncbi:hypothetical protein AB6A40_007455 [Gnathostoma spinigerum]|uniref:Uncharacterized protein n=1 Tax=Gnathostoma spinigerum TaxID=75299 RepID=A0ABD6EN93_9BILA